MAGRLRPRFRRRAAAAAVSALVIVGVLGALLATRSPAVAATSGVTIDNGTCTGGGTSFCYAPETLTVAVGDTVTWTNMSGFQHTATSCTSTACPGAPANTGTDTFNQPIAATNGSSSSFVFMNAGMYTYYCAIHGYSAMHATVTVTSTPPTPTPTPTPTPAVLPPRIKSFSPTSGPVGTTVTILGAHLKHATVSFNGMRAMLVTDAGKKIVATVPAGATTGKITVTTPGGTVMSATSFTVT